MLYVGRVATATQRHKLLQAMMSLHQEFALTISRDQLAAHAHVQLVQSMLGPLTFHCSWELPQVHHSLLLPLGHAARTSLCTSFAMPLC